MTTRQWVCISLLFVCNFIIGVLYGKVGLPSLIKGIHMIDSADMLLTMFLIVPALIVLYSSLDVVVKYLRKVK